MSTEQLLTPTIITSGGADWDLAASTRLSNEDTTRILKQYQETGDVQLRNEVVQANLRLVAYLAGRFKGRGLSLDELMSEGAAALLRATETFDTTRGVSFGSYAATAITHSMRRALGTVRHVVAIPSQVRRRLSRHRRASDSFFALHGRNPSHQEMLGEAREKGLIPATPGTVDPGTTGELSADQTQVVAPTTGGIDAVVAADVRSRVREALGALDERTAAVLGLRFGLDNGAPRSWQRVAEHVGISVSEAKARAADGMSVLRGRLAGEIGDLEEGAKSPRNVRRELAA
jgi:RNA polymerase sigma factor (sigma-70 family)